MAGFEWYEENDWKKFLATFLQRYVPGGHFGTAERHGIHGAFRNELDELRNLAAAGKTEDDIAAVMRIKYGWTERAK